jgi:hypothetical protein
MLLAIAMVLLPLTLGGCAKLNQWLEGTAGEEEKKDQEDPAKTFADQQKALNGEDKAKRKDAVGKLVDLATAKPPTNPELAAATETVRPQALKLAISLLADSDPAVAEAALDRFGSVTGFAEKTEDERQLDPEAYDRQLTLKRAVLTDGLPALTAAVQSSDADLRYGALVVLSNLAKPPVVSADAKLPEAAQEAAARAELKQVAPFITPVALDAAMPLDTRLLATEVLATLPAWDQMPLLAPLLRDKDEAIRGRAAMALAQAATAGEGGVKSTEPQLAALAESSAEPESVRWRATLALGAMHSPQGAELTTAMLPPPPPPNSKREPDPSDAAGMAPLEAYRSYALAEGGAAQAVATLNAGVDKAATKAEEDLAAERKKGYK